MNRSTWLICAGLLLLGPAACDRRSMPSATAGGAETSVAPAPTPGASTAAAPNTTAGADFVTRAAETDMYEIAAAKLALNEATHPDVKTFARAMIGDHTRSTSDLEAAISASGQPFNLPQGPSPFQRAHMDALRAAPKGAFDRTYVAQMIETHQQAKEVLGAYAANGDVAQLRAFAAKTLPMVARHLLLAQSLQAKM